MACFEINIDYFRFLLNDDTKTAELVIVENKDLIRSVLIPETILHWGNTYKVTRIGTYALGGCPSLAYVGIGKYVSEIGNGAFSNCPSLENITIPDSITTIGERAFECCKSFTTIDISKFLTNIGDGAFMGCNLLSAINVSPENPNYCSIDGILFDKNKTVLVQYPSGILSEKYNIPDGVTMIGNYAFACNEYLTSISIPEYVTIGEHAFSECSLLESVCFRYSFLSSRKTTIEPYAFNLCKSLISINLVNTTSIGDFAFRKCGLHHIELPSIEEIGNGAFEGCKYLISVKIGDGVTCIKHKTFYECESLETLIIPDSIRFIESEAFYSCSSMIFIVIPDNIEYIGSSAFSRCLSLRFVAIGKNVKEIKYDAFLSCYSLETIIFSEGVERIGSEAFGFCKSLTIVNIPDSVIEIGRSPFVGCQSLLSINVSNENPNYSTIDGVLFDKDKTILLQYPGGKQEAYTVPNSVLKIENSAFAWCSLHQLTIPNSVTHISCSFMSCESLTSITLSKNIKKFADDIFDECHALQTIIVPVGKREEYCKIGLESYRNFIIESEELAEDDIEIHLPSTTIEETILLNIAKGYEMGIGMTKNLAQAVLIYSQAADKGCAEAAFHLGELYELGDGLQQDYQQAIEWYTKAIALYHPSAETRKKHCEHVLHDEEQCLEEYQREIQSQLPQLPTTKYIFFDTECNGLPKYYNIDVCITSNWPRLIQLAWIVTDEVGNIVKRQNYVIKPNGFVINDKIAVLTSINTVRAQREGVELVNALSEFMADIEDAQLIIGHNIDFDMHIVGCELFRENMNYNKLMTKPTICTMQKSTNFCAIPSNGNHAGYKWPKLEELHQKLFGTTFSGAHDAMSDVEATRKCYFELKKKGIL